MLLSFAKTIWSENSYVESFCKLGAKSDCDSLIRSNASSIFGIIHLSELGALYFTGGIITLIISSVATVQISGLVWMFTLLALPFTFYSIFHQWRVAKVWCPLCIVVMITFWMEFLSFMLLGGFSWSEQSILISLIGYGMPLVFWLANRQSFINSLKLPDLERQLARFYKNDVVFKALLQAQTSIDMGSLADEISTGPEGATIILTLLSRPTCMPCAKAHLIIEDLRLRYADRLSVRYRFIPSTSKKAVDEKVIHHLMQIYFIDGIDRYQEALSSWYELNTEDNFLNWQTQIQSEQIFKTRI